LRDGTSGWTDRAEQEQKRRPARGSCGDVSHAASIGVDRYRPSIAVGPNSLKLLDGFSVSTQAPSPGGTT
jgi:hypothetical protein